jgi:SecD/SecF fusion protein
MLKLFDYPFSLSGIAAILIALGMAVDANVLIFERLREND